MATLRNYEKFPKTGERINEFRKCVNELKTNLCKRLFGIKSTIVEIKLLGGLCLNEKVALGGLVQLSYLYNI